jgi:hypothetical protein
LFSSRSRARSVERNVWDSRDLRAQPRELRFDVLRAVEVEAGDREAVLAPQNRDLRRQRRTIVCF